MLHNDKSEPDPEEKQSAPSRIFYAVVRETKNNANAILNALVNAIGSMSTSLYWLAQYVDILANLDGEGDDELFAEMSVLGLPIGVVLALIITTGSVYAHYILNTNSTYAVHHKDDIMQPEVDNILLEKVIELSRWQKFFWILDFISHTGDGAGTGLFVFSLFNRDPDRATKIYAQIVATIFGAVAARSDAITCGHNMRLHNRNKFFDSQRTPDTTAAMYCTFFANIFDKLAERFADDSIAQQIFTDIADILNAGATKLETLPVPRRDVINASDENHYLALRDDDDENDAVKSRSLPRKASR
jgi:hypothetical protein